MIIDDLPDDEYITIKYMDGTDAECRILGKTIYDGYEYAVCEEIEGLHIVLVDVRTLDGQCVPLGEEFAERVIGTFFEEHPDLVPKWLKLKTENKELVVLKDDEGKNVFMEFIDYFEEQGTGYIFLLDALDESPDEIIILEVHEKADGEEEYISIEDERLLENLFDIFKDRNKDEFDFS